MCSLVIFRLVSGIVVLSKYIYLFEQFNFFFFLRIVSTVQKFSERILYANVDLPALAAIAIIAFTDQTAPA